MVYKTLMVKITTAIDRKKYWSKNSSFIAGNLSIIILRKYGKSQIMRSFDQKISGWDKNHSCPEIKCLMCNNNNKNNINNNRSNWNININGSIFNRKPVVLIRDNPSDVLCWGIYCLLNIVIWPQLEAGSRIVQASYKRCKTESLYLTKREKK